MKTQRDIERENWLKVELAKWALISRGKYVLTNKEFKPNWGTPYVLPGDKSGRMTK